MANHPDDEEMYVETPEEEVENRRLYWLNHHHIERDREFRAEQKRWEEMENQHVSIKPTFGDYVRAYELEVPLAMSFGAGVSIVLACLISLL
jgi:hypothetical protein